MKCFFLFDHLLEVRGEIADYFLLIFGGNEGMEKLFWDFLTFTSTYVCVRCTIINRKNFFNVVEFARNLFFACLPFLHQSSYFVPSF